SAPRPAQRTGCWRPAQRKAGFSGSWCHSVAKRRGWTARRVGSDAGLLVLHVPVRARSHGWILGLARRRHAFDERVVVRVMEKGDRWPGLLGGVARRIDHAVGIRNPAVVGPPHQ